MRAKYPANPIFSFDSPNKMWQEVQIKSLLFM